MIPMGMERAPGRGERLVIKTLIEPELSVKVNKYGRVNELNT